MAKIKKPSPPEHIVIVDTNVLWHKDKEHVVNPDFDSFWDKYVAVFPMKLVIPEVVKGELLYQQTTSAHKCLEKVNEEMSAITRITWKKYSHRVNAARIKKEVEERLNGWIMAKKADVIPTPVDEINWQSIIRSAIWRESPFVADTKNSKNEKGFRDSMVLETVSSVCRSYSKDENIAFICNDYALRTSSEKLLGELESFSAYESLENFKSFIELTRKNLTERFVKSIFFRARQKFRGLFAKGNFFQRIHEESSSKIENPVYTDERSSVGPPQYRWKHIGLERVRVIRPQFESLEGERTYHWLSKVIFARLYELESMPGSFVVMLWGSAQPEPLRRLMLLTIDFHWKARVRADGRFFDCKVVEHKESAYSFNEPTSEDLERYRMQKFVENTTQLDVSVLAS